ncbi:TonB-dependent receptor [Ideonella paludis]|uniref:TonB-dependent receptor n=1 Tax=Ideonella paludis TaxID=1233411 RepID=UPI00362FA8A2
MEVLKGPASAVYGSDAIGGVIQVFTRRSDGPLRADVGLAAGSQGTVKLEAAVRGGTKTFDHAASLSVERSSGFNATNEKSTFSYVPDRDGYRRANGSLRLGAEVSSGHRLSLVALKNRTDSQYDGSRSKPLVDDHAITNTTAARLAWDAQWSRDLRTELSLGEGRDAYETTPSVYQTETRIRSLALNGSYQLGAGISSTAWWSIVKTGWTTPACAAAPAAAALRPVWLWATSHAGHLRCKPSFMCVPMTTPSLVWPTPAPPQSAMQ